MDSNTDNKVSLRDKSIVVFIIVGILVSNICMLTLRAKSKDYKEDAYNHSRNFIYGYMNAGNYETYMSFLNKVKKYTKEPAINRLYEVPQNCTGSEEDGYKNNIVKSVNLTVETNYKYKSIEEFIDDYYNIKYTDSSEDYDMYGNKKEETSEDESNKTKLGYISNGNTVIKFGGVTELNYEFLFLLDSKGRILDYYLKLIK